MLKRPRVSHSENEVLIKNKPTRTRRKFGRLKGLMDMPLDVSYEIFAHLYPWICCTLHGQRGHSPMPGFSEPAWINLLYEAICHLCHKNISRTIDFDFGPRICSKCYEDGKSVLTAYEILIDGASDDILDMIPCKYGTRKPYKNKTIYLKRDVDEVKAHILSLPENQREIYSQQRRLVYKKLVVLGYERDLESIGFPDSLKEHRLVKQARPLTEKGKIDNIRDEVVAIMETTRNKRLLRERTEVVFSRKATAVSVLRTYKNSSVGLPYTTILPSLPDFYDFVPVKHILDLPSEVVVDIKSFDDLLRAAGHPNPSSLTGLGQKIRWLELAQNIFICNGPIHISRPKILSYPSVLSHVCCTVQPWPDDSSLTELYDETVEWVWTTDFFGGAYDDPWFRCAWNAEYLSINQRLTNTTVDLIRCLGFDPDTATKDEPKDAGIYGWRALVHHFNGYWHNTYLTEHILTPKGFEKLTVQGVKRNKKLEVCRMEVGDRIWCCVHCRDLPLEVYPTTLSKIQKHIDDVHSITEPIINQDYYKNLGAAPLLLLLDICSLNLMQKTWIVNGRSGMFWWSIRVDIIIVNLAALGPFKS
ncbi:hypothetical protein F5146DRAFT_1152287 [Armillaria mellea]|nr:hypothetical protein F5146DRAFT_1152287 [Armillaria mellea]